MLRWLINRLQERATALGVPVQPPEPANVPPLPTVAEPSAQAKTVAGEMYRQGNLALHRGRLDEAEQLYRDALRSHPRFAEACANLGALLRDKGRSAEADRYLSLAVEIQPTLAPASYNLAMLRIDQAHWREAAILLRQSLVSDPKQAEAQYWLGNALMGLGDALGARKAYQAAIRLDANYVQPRWGLAVAQLPAIPQSDEDQSQAPDRFAKEFAKLRAWLRVPRAPDAYLAVGAQQPYYLAYIAGNHKALLADYGKVCANLMAMWLHKVGFSKPESGVNRRLRIGIVSAHIRNHSVWHAVVRGWMEHLDTNLFEVYLFHTGSLRDNETQWAERKSASFSAQVGSWQQWAKRISDSRLDALIYPELGMDATSVRLSSMRLAPMQLAAWGHPITTGLPTIDGYISGGDLEPEHAAEHYTEELYRLPGLGSCYQPYGTQPQRIDFALWGIATTDTVMLCPGMPFKYAPKHDLIWIEIARQCPSCKLLFFRSQGDDLSALLEQRLRRVFASAGVEFDAVVRFIPWQSQAGFFGFLDRADVFLDTLDFSGFNTAMQAVERNTPIVAFEGEFMRGRFASAILRQLGLTDWIAHTPQEYVQIALHLVQDSAARDTIRAAKTTHHAKLFGNRASVDALGGLLQRLCRG